MHYSPLARAPPSSLPHSPFPSFSPNHNYTSLSFIPPKPTNFIISATPPQITSSPPQTPKFDSHFTNRDGFFPNDQSSSLFPLQEGQKEENRNKNVQDLTDRFKDGNFETITEFNHLFMDLVLADEVDLAYKLSSSLPAYDFSADSLTFSILIHCYCKRNEPMEAKRVLEHMIENGFESPKVKTFTQVINSFCKKGRLNQAFEVFGMMSKVKCEPTINTYNCLLKGLCYVGRVEEANELFTKIKKSWKTPKIEGTRLEPLTLHPDINIHKLSKIKKSWSEPERPGGERRLEPMTLHIEKRLEPVTLHMESRLEPDIYTYTAMMDGFCKVGRSNEALELLDEAIEMGLSPNVVTYNTIFNGYFKEGRPMEGFGLLRQMKERNCTPDYISYSTLLHGLLQWGEIRAGVRVYNEMLEMGFEVDERMMNTLLRGLCRRSRKEKELLTDAYQVFDEMSKRGCNVDPCAFELIIEAFCNGNEMDRAFGNLCEMIRMGLAPRTFTLNVVLRGLCIEGKIEKALLALVSVLRGRSGMPDRVVFDVLINEMNRQGMVINATCVYCVALKNGVIPLKKPI